MSTYLPTSVTLLVSGEVDGEFIVNGFYFKKGVYREKKISHDWYDGDSVKVLYESKGAKKGNLVILTRVN
ncbi:MAG: hypothetical protein WBP58_15115 [Chitinophagaceae bacterium]